ncbi:TPA: CCA tRNA nucleotidyltransferase [Candidatus Bathyarchaeota archaeon]|nr:CCA tRNA nucleotidyltransferase [Candidatus Bathyarchaeota archaeon]
MLDERVREVLAEAGRRVIPTEEEERRVRALCSRLVDRVSAAARRVMAEATVAPQGSVVKGTWLRGAVDFDIFVLLPPSLTKKGLGEVGLRIAREAMEGYEQIDRYAEHPYLECVVPFDGGEARVDIVPCYRVERGMWLSATDRTPYHTEYVSRRLKESENLANETRLFKAFLRGIGIYGAEIRVQGFSGYACELVTIRYGSFVDALRSASRWRRGEVVDVEGHYRGREHEARRLFGDAPLIIVDPIDERRNVAAALSLDSFELLIAAAHSFLRRPSLSFFFAPEVELLDEVGLRERIRSIGGNLLLVRFGRVPTKAPDVLWGQLYKTRDALKGLLRAFDFRISRTWVWSDEKENSAILFKLESLELPMSKLHGGPPAHATADSERFLEKNLGAPATVFGPWIERGRWAVELRRRYASARDLLKDKLSDGGREVGIARLVAEAIRGGFEILCDDEIWSLYRANEAFARAFTRFLAGRPVWL